MINRLADYKYVGPRKANDDLYTIKVDGGIMPKRSGLSVDILRGEDIIFLEEAAIERYDYWKQVRVGDLTSHYEYNVNSNYISGEGNYKPAYFERKVNKDQEKRVYTYIEDLYKKRFCLKGMPVATILSGDVSLRDWLSSYTLTTADMHSSYDFSDKVLRRSDISSMFEDIKQIQYTYMNVGDHVTWNNLSGYDRAQGNEMSSIRPPTLWNNEMQYRTESWWFGSQYQGVLQTYSYDWCSAAQNSGLSAGVIYGDVKPYSDSSPRFIYGWRCVGRWGYTINSKGVPDPGVIHYKTAFLTRLNMSLRPNRSIFDMIMQDYFGIEPVHMPYYDYGSQPKDDDPTGGWFFGLRIFPFVIFQINQNHTKWW